MGAKVSAAADALTAHQAAQNAARSATVALYDSLREMGDLGSALIKKIRAKAEQDGNNNAYVLANVPPPATPAPVPPPGQPTAFEVALTQTGALDMTWKCPNPPGAGGTVYNVFRRVGSTGEFDYLGGTGVKEFTDESAPAGAPLIMYKIQAVRSTLVGAWATFNVFMGVSDNGAAMVTKVENTSPKLAA